MAIHEPGHYHSPGRVDFDGFPRLRQVFQPPGRADFDDDAVPNENGTVLNYAKISQV
jgi:hypothetical protein